MKLPILKEIKLNTFTVNELVESLRLQEAGSFPTYIVLNSKTIGETNEILDSIAAAFVQLNTNPKFPYPFYAVTDVISYHPSIPICKSVKDLPRHFVVGNSRLKGRELAILNKANLLKDKVVNLPFYERISKFHTLVKKQRSLYDSTKKLAYLENLIDQVRKSR